jgi:D-amino-acid dehydrogenase
MTTSDHTIIVGGGIVGVSAAYELAKRGASVTLLDREHFDVNCSTGNAGIIALGHPPMPRPGMTRDTLKMLFDPANPLYIPLRWDPELFRWLWNFRKACTERQFNHSMRVLAELGWLAGECFDQLVDEEQLECDYGRTGWMEVFLTHARFEQGRREAELLREYGYTANEISQEQLREEEPAFLPHVLGGVHYPESRFAQPQRVLSELADRAAKRGAVIRTGANVKRLLVESGRAVGAELETGEQVRGDGVVLAAGIWSSPLARAIGVTIPMQAGKGYHVELTPPSPCITKTCVLAETYIAMNPTGGVLRLAGTVEFSGINHRIVQKRLDMLRFGAAKYLHGIDEQQIVGTWCGLRPCTADGLPAIGWSPQVADLFIATGHAMMGFALGPVTGRFAAEAILDGETSMNLSPFAPGRFIGQPHVERPARRRSVNSPKPQNVRV